MKYFEPKHFLLVLCFSFFWIQLVLAQEAIPAKRIEKEINFDGIPDEELWKELAMPLAVHQPVFEENYQGESEFYMGYNEDYLWVAGKMIYSDAAEIAAVSKKRDIMDPGNDYFGIAVDSYNDNENALAFYTTPTGLRWDATIFNDAQGDPTQGVFPINMSWNTFWDVRTRVEDNIWYVELRIPVTSLKFQDVGGKAIMGVTIWWWSTRIGQTVIYPAITREWGGMSAFKPSQFQDLEFSDIKSRNPIYLAPYATAGLQGWNELDENSTEYLDYTDNTINAGLDAKFTLGSGFTMDLTVNTDFAQVEADNQQVNLTRFSLFFPEKRIFFQERSNLFSVKSGLYNTVFYSRKIGLDEDANIVPILGGARLVGRAGKWDVGFIDMQSKKTANQSSNNYGVLRLRRQIGEGNTYVGGILTNKLGSGGKNNSTYALDGIINLKNQWYLDVIAANVSDSSNASLDQTSKVFLNLEKRTIFGPLFKSSVARIGEYYDPEMGFELRNNNLILSNAIGYGIKPDEKYKLQTASVKFESEIFRNLGDGKNDSEKHGISFNTESNSASQFVIRFSKYYERILEDFELYNTTITAGKYDYYGLEYVYSSPTGNRLFFMTNGYFGDFFNGSNATINLGPAYKPNQVFLANLQYQIVKLNFPGNERDDLLHFITSTLEYTPTVNASFSLLTQYNTYDKSISSNFRFRYNPREGVDLFVVINDTENTDLNRFMPVEPRLPRYDSRAIIVKYVHTFIL